jgi:hypothetical protein
VQKKGGGGTKKSWKTACCSDIQGVTYLVYVCVRGLLSARTTTKQRGVGNENYQEDRED